MYPTINILLKYLQTKVYIPQYCLAFEYQGEPHFFSTIAHGSARSRKENDSLKAQFAKDAGITLIQIPFWWDNMIGSLAATIHKYRPDIQLDAPVHGLPIQPKIPYRNYKYKPNAAHQVSQDIDPTGWYVQILQIVLEILLILRSQKVYLLAPQDQQNLQ
jgi:hypothetical protein